MRTRYSNRTEAGRVLADALRQYAGRRDVLVLALPRGGVPVAHVVAEALGAPLDVLLVRKLGVPIQEELAMGAIASGGTRVLNEELVRDLGIADEVIESVTEHEWAELRRRERIYRGDRPAPDRKGRCAIVVDDGLATGSTMRAAVRALREQGSARIVVAVPVGPPETVQMLGSEADEVVCPVTPHPFRAISAFYEEFGQISDETVRELLASLAGERATRT
jgi:putative phosphoribosyl transferase